MFALLRTIALLLVGLPNVLQDAPTELPARSQVSKCLLRLSLVDAGGTPIAADRTSLHIINDQAIGRIPRIAEGGVYEFRDLVAAQYWLAIEVRGYVRQVSSVTIVDKALALKVVLTDAPEDLVVLSSKSATADLRYAGISVAGATRSRIGMRVVDAATKESITEAHVILSWEDLEFFAGNTREGLLDLDIRTLYPFYMSIHAGGYVPRNVEITAPYGIDDKSLELFRSIPVTGSIVGPAEILMNSVMVEYAPLREYKKRGKLWREPVGNDGRFVVDGCEGPLLLRAAGWDYKAMHLWSTALMEVDYPRIGEPKLELRMTVPVVLMPSAVSEVRTVRLCDLKGLLVCSDKGYSDVPRRVLVLPGDYVIRWDDRSREICVGENGLSIALE